jgi:hypothetical protein
MRNLEDKSSAEGKKDLKMKLERCIIDMRREFEILSLDKFGG